MRLFLLFARNRAQILLRLIFVLVFSAANAAEVGQALTSPIQALTVVPPGNDLPPGHSSIARDAGGNFVVVWADVFSTTNFRMDARLFAADGTPRGGQFAIDDTRAVPRTSGGQPIAVAMDAAGDFVVAWVSNDPQDPANPLQDSIYVKIFKADGTPRSERIVAGVTRPFRSPYGSSVIEPPAVAMSPSGDVLVAWISEADEADGLVSSWQLKARRYALDGTPIGATDTLAKRGTVSFITEAVRIAASDTGEFAVVYQPGIAFEQGYPYCVRLYRADGRLSPLPIRLSTTLDLQPFISKRDYAISFVGNDDLLLAWSAPDRANPRKQTQEKVFLRRYSKLGLARGLPVEVATRSPSAYFSFGTTLSLAPIPSGGSVITWPDVSGDRAGVYGRYYAAGETPLGPSFLIATPALANTGAGGRPGINATTDPRGNLLATFGSVFVQIFQGP